MNWYPGRGVDDLVVPKDQDLLDRLPSSPKIWSRWGTYAPESPLSPNKCYGTDMNMTEEDFNFNGFCNEVEMEISVQDNDHYSGSSACGGSLEDSLQRTSLSCGRPDYELDPLAGIEQLDEIFLSSLLEDLPKNEDFSKLFGVMPANNLLTDIILDSQSNSSDQHSIGSSKYLQTHAFSPSVDWEEGEAVASPFIPCNSEQKGFLPLKALPDEPQIASEENIAHELVDEETSLEETVLQELKMVMAQMTDKTRICFRDALYRLAEGSKQHVIIFRQSGNFAAETPQGRVHDMQMRSGRKKAMESETNIIDRTIANLMFNKMDLNVEDFPVAAEINPKQEVISVTGSQNDSSNRPRMRRFCQAMLAGDAEVPTLSLKHHQVAAKSPEDFSKKPAKNMQKMSLAGKK